jgi:uncharacterized protein
MAVGSSGIRGRPGKTLRSTASRFRTRSGVFEDANALSVEDAVQGEQRFVTIGIDAFGRLLVVVYTWRGDAIRIIAARKATRTETRDYENQL